MADECVCFCPPSHCLLLVVTPKPPCPGGKPTCCFLSGGEGKKEKEENCKKKTAHVFTCVGKQLQISRKQLENESRSVSVCFCEKQCEGGPLTAMCDVKLNCFVLRLKSLNICFVKCTLTYLNDLLRNRWFAICELSI